LTKKITKKNQYKVGGGGDAYEIPYTGGIGPSYTDAGGGGEVYE
jgi:hypothetical protein